MPPLAEHSNFKLLPHKLSVEDIENPLLAIDDLFGVFDLADSRELLWELLKLCVSKSFDLLSQKERNGLLTFYEKLEKTIEAVYIMHNKTVNP